MCLCLSSSDSDSSVEPVGAARNPGGSTDSDSDEELTGGPVVVFPSNHTSPQQAHLQVSSQAATDPTEVDLQIECHKWTPFDEEDSGEGMAVDSTYKWSEDHQANTAGNGKAQGLTEWASFANFDAAFGNASIDGAGMSVSTAAESSTVGTVPDNKRVSPISSPKASGEVSSSDSSDSSDERTGSYSFGNDEDDPDAADSLPSAADKDGSSSDDSDREGSYSFGNEEPGGAGSEPHESRQPVADGPGRTADILNAIGNFEDEPMEDNFDFLSKGGFLTSSQGADDVPVEDARAKAQAALKAFEAASGLG